MFRFSSGYFTFRSASRTESSVISLAGSSAGAAAGGAGTWGGCVSSAITSTIAGIPPPEQAVRTFAIAGLALCLTAARANSQQPASPAPPPPTGWELFAIPTLNFSSDEGAGYGALAELYNYGSGVSPYKYMLRPLV